MLTAVSFGSSGPRDYLSPKSNKKADSTSTYRNKLGESVPHLAASSVSILYFVIFIQLCIFSVRVLCGVTVCVCVFSEQKNKYLFQLSVSTLNINITLSFSFLLAPLFPFSNGPMAPAPANQRRSFCLDESLVDSVIV